MEATLEDQHSQHALEKNINAYRSMRDRMHPPRMSAPSCIVPPTEQLVIRPHIVSLLPTFHRMESENLYAHIKEFEDICNTFREGGASIDLMRLKLFPFTLKDKAKERYMKAINVCPHHGFDTWLLVSYFYDGMSSSMKQLLETMCGGDFMMGRMKSQPNASNAKAGMYTLNEDTDMKAKFAAMTRRLEELEVKKIQEVQVISETLVQTKPSNNNASYGNTYNSNWRNHPNFSWKPRAPQYMQPGPSTLQASNLEQANVNLSKVVGDFVGDQKSINAQLRQEIANLNKRMDGKQNNLSQKIDNLQYPISRLTNLNTVQEKGNFLLNLIKIPRVSMK
ncbi:hypothetical protein CK203_116459 [Vitis vinifera]|uniref:Retrotransposon gag domain-containing protein n=1 Tax=Vitis vinifera TaxID=29760 RepID=A0A438CUK8_VITVI|nr:hypothetical protein CK203_116459 [Vitis vinifera]